ncbi:UvrD-helicase domain-containing protein [Methanococcoides alaskense]|uniref:DNA 3'-5' helicase n=1 Tax=Methanococcoides alaskense TaxID=325778 RepID=A0AA90TXF5_9EURY|nr:UvrD-helicase domain-containing protein [Methanococcoides alaskense]MDA0525416.1 UvrD-helicase domain-containing protein [Methanococcoides alaskense]MDR6221651.1 DNA helicase-2/ATP-dependent DNA helicase PcrA [Methanococcoides alaskense]
MTSKGLNKGQSKAVDYTSGPLLILAGPGSGKTLTIAEKVVKLIKDGTAPERTLALTFSEKAAGEMQERIEKQIGTDSGITVSTFHSFCNDLIRDFSLHLGINHNVKLIPKEHAYVWGMNNIDSFGLEYIEIPTHPYDLISSMLEGVSQFHDHLITPSELQDHVTHRLTNEPDLHESVIDRLQMLSDLTKFYEHYQQYKKDNNFIDFDDMINIACNLLKDNEIVRNQVRDRYDYILVDEFQDTNYAQLFLIHLIADGDNLTCVADDDQCIYRFRGAYLSNITQLQDYYNSLEKIPLEINYRSTSQIVEVSQQLIRNNPERQVKDLVSHNGDGDKVMVVKTPDEINEADWVADEIKKLVTEGKLEPNDIYVLTRKRADGQKFNDALKSRMIPVEYVGSLQLTSYPIIQEALAYICVVSDPFNNGISFAKIFAREGVTEHNLQKINLLARKLSRKYKLAGDGIYLALCDHFDEIDITQKSLVNTILGRVQHLLDFKKNHLPSDTVKYLLMEDTDLYRSQMQDDDTNSRKNIHLLNSLVKMVKDLELVDGGSNFDTAMEYVDLVFGIDVADGESSEENTVKVMTIHQSKGKEAKAVFVCDMAARHLPLQHMKKTFTVPSQLAKGVQRDEIEGILHMEEERRLAYVAMTRAREHLYLVFPDKYSGNKRSVKPSAFLDQIEYLSNPQIEYIETTASTVTAGPDLKSPLEVKKDEFQRLVSIYSRQGQVKEAMEALVVLAQLREVETHGNLATFDLKNLLRVNPKEPKELEDLIDNRVPPLVDLDMRFSASKIKEYIDCPLRFKYNSILNIPTPQMSFFQVGTSVHSVYEQMSKLKMQGESIDMKLANKTLDDSWDGSVFSSDTQEKQEHGKMKEMIEFWFELEKECKDETISVEEWFELEIDGHSFGGFIDRIDQTPDGEYVVIDYKTGKTTTPKKKLKEDVQIALYCLAVKEKYGKLPVQAGHLYVNPNVQELRLVDVVEEEVEAVVGRIKETVNSIMDEDFEVKDKPNCYWCNYGGICSWVNGK